MKMRTYQMVTNLSCNLDCEYCYERKNTRANTPESIVNFVKGCFNADRNNDEIEEVYLDFIGGESFMRPDLVECALETAVELAERDSRRLFISISSNGTLFHKPRVQDLIERYGHMMSIGISIDGPAEIHDRYRVFTSDRSGSYDSIIENLKYIDGKVFDLGFKATFTKETLPRYAESMKHIIDICDTLKGGFTVVAGNVIFEDVLDKEMAPGIANQFIEIIDYWIEKGFHKRYGAELAHIIPSVGFGDAAFSVERVKMLNEVKLDEMDEHFPDHRRAYCGAVSAMRCLGFDDKVYGCNRFMTSFPENAVVAKLEGDVLVPVESNLGKEIANQFDDYPEECQRCPIKMACGSCAAAPYEEDNGDKEARGRYHAAKRQCGWTFAKVLAAEYWYSLFGSYNYADQWENKCCCQQCNCESEK